MEYAFWIYLVTRLDTIQSVFGWLIFLSVILLAGTLIINIDSDYLKDETVNGAKFYRKIALSLFVMSIIGYTVTPTKQDAMIIAGSIGVIEATKALAGSEIAKKSVEIVEVFLANELEKQKSKSGK
jgi:hypothetical protein